MLRKIWSLLKAGIEAFIEDDALSHGAAISFYIITAFAPVLYIAAAIAGMVFGWEAATSALRYEIARLVGPDGAHIVHVALHNTLVNRHGFWPNILGALLVIVTASGVFGEMQTALNAFWNAKPRFTVWELIRTRLLSLGLVLALGFLLLISLVMNAMVTALGDRIEYVLPIGKALAVAMNFGISFVLIAVLFAAIYKVLPDVALKWGDVIAGALVTAALFLIGEYLIALYLGSGLVGQRYGAAGGLFLLLLWIYYTTQVFLLGAEFTKVYASRHGSRSDR
ncbi:MAG: YihY/virulence factor BrkB family protein [Alphaproteobacteria bacterium]|nr:YihY/virulence factor BrkB family protein [Alphaproteobacteria bacterium]MBV9063424.1 YihY/virulence factor BrkB family protein [Alphaproteobacteria bacterium]